MARNCHKAVYNGILLRELDAVYAYPVPTKAGIQGQITAEQIAALLKEHPEVEAVLITSPTYDGVVSDIKAIAEVAHAHDLPLIVDAAHGAHLGFSKEFPENPIALGADVVIESVHKTLPAFTQTALLHLCSDRVSTEKIKKYLGIYETSSPSYILMAGIDRCMEYLKDRGAKDLEQLAQNLARFYEKAKGLKNIKVLQKQDLSTDEAYDFDCSKILIFSKKSSVTGSDMHRVLLEKYHLQMEMISGQYVLALCSVMDTPEGFERLIRALEEMDASELFMGDDSDRGEIISSAGTIQNMKELNGMQDFSSIYRPQHQLLPIHQAEELAMEVVPLQQAVGKAAGTYLYLYPPGIPLIVPGEEITAQLVEDIEKCQRAGLTVEGFAAENRICIVNFS